MITFPEWATKQGINFLRWRPDNNWPEDQLIEALRQRLMDHWDVDTDDVLGYLGEFLTQTDDNFAVDIFWNPYQFEASISKGEFATAKYWDRNPNTAILNVWLDLMDNQWGYFLEFWKGQP